MLSAGMQRAVLLVLGYLSFKASHVALVVKNLPPSAGNVRDMSSVPGSGRSPGGAYTFSILAWRIPWTEEPGRPHK